MTQQHEEPSSSQEKLRLLAVAEEGMRARRDALNVGMGLIRRIRLHVLTGAELDEAARRANIPALIGDVDQILRILAGHEAIFDPPAWLSREEEIQGSSDDRQSAPPIRSPSRRPRDVRVRSQPVAPVVHQVRRKRSRHTDAWGITLPIVRKAFCGEPPLPQNLDEALERAYSTAWGSRFITITSGKRENNGMIRRTYADDVDNPKSIIKQGITHTIACCIKYAEGGEGAFPADRPVGPNVKKLTQELNLPGRKEEILGVLLAWGIQVEEPVAAG